MQQTAGSQRKRPASRASNENTDFSDTNPPTYAPEADKHPGRGPSDRLLTPHQLPEE